MDEFEYLLASMGRLVSRVEEKTGRFQGFVKDKSDLS